MACSCCLLSSSVHAEVTTKANAEVVFHARYQKALITQTVDLERDTLLDLARKTGNLTYIKIILISTIDTPVDRRIYATLMPQANSTPSPTSSRAPTPIDFSSIASLSS